MADERSRGIDPPWEGLTGTVRLESYLLAARTGNRSAMDALVTEMTPLVWHVARGHGLDRGAAEDVVATVWMVLFSRLDQVVDLEALAGELIATTRRVAKLPHGYKKPPVPLSNEVVRLLPRPQLETVEGTERERRLWSAFLRLPQRCQELLRLTALAGRAEYQVVAEVMKMPRGSVGPTRNRCLNTLRDLLSESEERSPGGEEVSLRQLDNVLDIADPVPEDLAARMAFVVAMEDALEILSVDEDRDLSARSSDQDDVTSRDDTQASGAQHSQQHGTRVLGLPFIVYVEGDDHQAAQELAAAIVEVLAQHEIVATADGPPVISSWFQRFILSVKRSLSSSEVQQRLQKSEHALEVVAVQKPMSEVNVQNADAAHKLLSAAEKCDGFVALVGSILMVKQTDEAGKINAYVRTLSVAQVRALENNPQALKSPSEILVYLETLSHEDATQSGNRLDR